MVRTCHHETTDPYTDGVLQEVDGHGIPHAFPVREDHSKLVAEKVVEWVQEIQKDL